MKLSLFYYSLSLIYKKKIFKEPFPNFIQNFKKSFKTCFPISIKITTMHENLNINVLNKL